MTKAWHVLALGISLMAGCGKAAGGRRSQCEAIRDTAVPIQEQNVKDALGMAPPDQKAALEQQGQHEIERYQANFVDVCTSVDAKTFACLEQTAAAPKAKPEGCDALLKAVWSTVLQ